MEGYFRVEVKLLILKSHIVLPLGKVCYLVSILFRDPGGGRPSWEALLPQSPSGLSCCSGVELGHPAQDPMELSDAFLEGYSLI